MKADETKIKTPLFLVIEGIDGAGKTTIQNNLKDVLTNLGMDVVLLREPTAGTYGRKIRKLLSEDQMPEPDYLLSLFIADREEDLKDNILPAMGNKKIVIMDRYFYSNAAYQGTENIPWQKILNMNFEKQIPLPDRVYFIDIHPEIAMKRIENRNIIDNKKSELFEKKDFLTKVRNNFLQMVKENGLFFIVDGTLSPEQIVKIIYNDIIDKFSVKC